MEKNSGINVLMADPKMVGIVEDKEVHLKLGPYGNYIRYNNKNYSLPSWARLKPDDLNLYQVMKIIEYKEKKNGIQTEE
jgi:topoisomerase IA-like protein